MKIKQFIAAVWRIVSKDHGWRYHGWWLLCSTGYVVCAYAAMHENWFVFFVSCFAGALGYGGGYRLGYDAGKQIEKEKRNL